MRKFAPILVIFAAVLLLYFPTFNVYFSQDDFFMFKVSLTDGTFTDFVRLFGIYPFEERGIAFYRPIFREALHNIYFSIFGLNHLPFRVLLLGIHFINISLVYFLIQNIFKKRLLSFLTALFFGISAANVATLYYIPGGIESSGAVTFALLTIISYKKYLAVHRFKFYLLSFVSFLLALASHEIILATPLILLALRSRILKLWPFFLSLIILLYIDLVKIGFSPGEQQYKFIFNPKTIIQSFSWYMSWGYGMPEMLIDFVLPGFKLNPNLLRYWGDFYKVIFPAFFVSCFILIFFIISTVLKRRSLFMDKRFLFFLFWLLTGLLPVIFLPSHKSSHYLIFVLAPFWALIFFVITQSALSKFLVFLFIASLLLLNGASIKLGEKTHWASTRGKTAQKLVQELKSKYPSLPKGSAIYFTNDPAYPYLTKEWGGTSKQASFVLNGADALQLLYKDPTLQVFYEDFGGVPKNFPKERVYQLMAKIL